MSRKEGSIYQKSCYKRNTRRRRIAGAKAAGRARRPGLKRGSPDGLLDMA